MTKKRAKKNCVNLDEYAFGVEPISKRRDDRKLQEVHPLNKAQEEYIKAINANQLIFATGPAGTGKSYISAAMAAVALEKKQISKMILTRPAVEAGESLGFLPGELEDKYQPYIEPFLSILYETLGKSTTEYYLKNKIIEARPMAFMRGMTFKDCWVILDEAQNTTPKQMQLFLTRIGENSKIIIDGDTTQCDINGPSGLVDGLNVCAGLPDSKFVRFTRDDVVRSGMVANIIKRYDLASIGAI